MTKNSPISVVQAGRLEPPSSPCTALPGVLAGLADIGRRVAGSRAQALQGGLAGLPEQE